LRLLAGKPADPLVQCAKVQDSELQELCETTNLLIKQFTEAHDFLASLSQGLLEIDPPPRNLLISPFKQLHSNLRHLTWQTKQVAVGDFSQHVDFLGEFSDAFNKMIASLRERHEIELALHRSEERLALAIDGANLGLWDYDLGAGEVVFNKRWAEMLEYNLEEIAPRTHFWHDLIHPDDKVNFLSAWEGHLKCSTPIFRVEHRLRTKSGRWKWMFCTGRVVDTDALGNAVRVAGIFVDITDRKCAEETARQTERLQAIAYLSGGVAHHFNNLLQMVIGSTSLSLEDLESGDLTEIKTTLEEMLEAATHGSEMVKRLQTFANVRADIGREDSALFDIAATARNAVEVSKPLWKAEPEKRGTKVSLHLDLEEGCLIDGKEDEIFEVFVNLIRNAAEAMPDGGDIEVQVAKKAAEVVIKVRDTGLGIPEDNLPRIFQPFWSSKGVGIGKGMGLAVTHGLVKRHSGAISVQSSVGTGTTFTITLPLAQKPVTKTEQAPTGTAESRLTILVVEDEEHIATLLERILVKAWHRVFKALSGYEALAIFHKDKVDLVVCDLGMPGMSGWNVGKALLSICQQKGIAKPPFILLTGWGSQELEREKIAECGVDAVVAKPIDPAALLASVQEIAAQFHRKVHDK